MSTGAIFIDLTKAFDLVDHYILLDKLNNIGFFEQSILWFNSCLHYRGQCVNFSLSVLDNGNGCSTRFLFRPSFIFYFLLMTSTNML